MLDGEPFSGATGAAPSRTHGHRLLPLIVVIAGWLAYANSLGGAFLFDDERYIVHNPRIQSLWPIFDLLDGRRPVVDLTLALNYAAGGLNVHGYHAVNVWIHVLAGLTLLGVVGRTLRLTGGGAMHDRRADWLALVVAVLWVTHPLQTQSVTYVIQRCESLMGLFYLLTLYCVIRGAGSHRRFGWYAAAVLSCALGMGSKAVMVSVPVVVFLYDDIFLCQSWRAALRKRWGLYAALGATWAVLWYCGVMQTVLDPSATRATVGFGYRDASPLAYGLTQPGVLLRYLTLSLWPAGLCLDYGWSLARAAADVVVPGFAVACLLAGTLWGLLHRSWVGFLGAWFFLILAPTSSFIPIRDALFEHRMYLPLVAVVVLAVVGADAALGHCMGRSGSGERTRRCVPVIATAIAALFLTTVTVARNSLYGDPVAMWADVVAKRPEHARGYENLGAAYQAAGEPVLAQAAYRRAIQLDPTAPDTHFNLGTALLEGGDPAGAIEAFKEETRLNPRHVPAYVNLGNALVADGRGREAIAAYRQAVELDPEAVAARVNMSNVLASLGRVDEAIDALEQVLELVPDSADVYYNLGNLLMRRSRRTEALAAYRRVLEIEQSYGPAYTKLGSYLLAMGRLDEGVAVFEDAIIALPEEAELHLQRGVALTMAGRLADAETAFRRAILLEPALTDAHLNLGNVLAALGRTDEAIEAYQRCVEIDPSYEAAQLRLARLLLKQRRREEALEVYRAVLKRHPDHPTARAAIESIRPHEPLSGAR
jgi:tetratricopeptide (TPR) repeat protein